MKNNAARNAHKAGHHYHKNEMEHHKVRDSHKAKNHSFKEKMHGIDDHAPIHHMGAQPKHLIGGSVADNHQEGIARKVQKPGAMDIGHHGSMADGWRHDRQHE